MTKYFPQLYDRLVAASTGGGAAVSDELADTTTSRYLLANTGGVEHPSNCPAQCVKVRRAEPHNFNYLCFISVTSCHLRAI